MLGLHQDHPLLISAILEHAATNHADVPIVSHSGAEITRLDYASLAARARLLASSLRAEGWRPGSFVGSLAWNTHRHLELFYAVTGIGAVLHTANPRLAPAQIAYTVNFTGYDTLFIDLDTLALAEQLAPQLPKITSYVIMAAREAMPCTSLPNATCYEDLIAVGKESFPWLQLDERTASTLCFTSGTTGDPKGALYTHRGCVLSALSSGGGNGWALSGDDGILALPGYFHCNGWAVPFLAPMYGARLVMPGRNMDTAFLHRLITEEGITVGPAVPTIWLQMLDHCRAHNLRLGNLNRLFTGGTAPPAMMIDAYMREYNVRTFHAWGMTETTHLSTSSFIPRDLSPDEAMGKMRSQGKPVFGNEIRIVDDHGAPLPRDGATPGHLQVRGHWIAEAYFRRPDIALITDGGWMQTGDVAVIDPDNTMHIVDRAKDVIKSGGEWISSQALEEAANRHTQIVESAVIAVEHPRWQERPLLIVVTEQGATLTTDDVLVHLSPLVPKWWLPDQVAFVSELPHGPTGKIQKDILRQWLRDGIITA
ncbi:MAG: long-chain fatty acid--CoA ligase [Acetobacteraceae bacterium]|nr:long-chain fatty acid--CoA ligase [Acetobacteraceae bacterium]